jgi:hypothetical protein
VEPEAQAGQGVYSEQEQQGKGWIQKLEQISEKLEQNSPTLY